MNRWLERLIIGLILIVVAVWIVYALGIFPT